MRSETIPPPRENDLLTAKVIGFAIEVHRTLGPGLLESAYEECLCFELRQNALLFRQQVYLPIIYKSVKLDCGYRLDIVIEDRIIVELKTVASHCLTGHFSNDESSVFRARRTRLPSSNRGGGGVARERRLGAREVEEIFSAFAEAMRELPPDVEAGWLDAQGDLRLAPDIARKLRTARRVRQLLQELRQRQRES